MPVFSPESEIITELNNALYVLKQSCRNVNRTNGDLVAVFTHSEPEIPAHDYKITYDHSNKTLVIEKTFNDFGTVHPTKLSTVLTVRNQDLLNRRAQARNTLASKGIDEDIKVLELIKRTDFAERSKFTAASASANSLKLSIECFDEIVHFLNRRV